MTTETFDAEQLRALDGLLMKRAPTGEDLVCLSRLKRDLGLSDAECEQRRKLAAQRKAKATAEAEAAAAFTGDAFVEEITVQHVHLNRAAIERYLEQGAPPLPPAGTVAWRRRGGGDAAEFAYLCTLLADLRAGKLRAGKVAYCKSKSDRFTPAALSLPLITAEAPPIALRIDEFSFVRLPAQTEKQLEAALKVLRSQLDREVGAAEMRPA